MTDTGTGLNFEAGIDLSKLFADASRMEARIKKIEENTTKTGKQAGSGFASAFKQFGITPATLGIGSIGAMMLKVGKDAFEFSKGFNSAMLEVKTISSSVTDDFKGFSDQIMNLSTQAIKDDAIGLSKAYYQIVSAGHDGADGMKILETAAKAATGGVTDTITAADGLTTVFNAWGKSASEVNKVSDLMFTTVRLGKTDMGLLSSNIAKVAPLASAMGVGMEEIFAATASITKQGTPTAEAFTQMRAALTAMNGVLGDGWSKTMTFQEGLAKVREMAGGSDTKLKELLGTDEAVLATLALTGEKAKGAADDLSAMSTSAGAANAAFVTMADDAGVKWQQVQNNWNKSMKEFGDNLRNASSGLADFLNKMMGDGADAGQSFADNSAQVSMLVGKLKDANLTLEERKKILDDISKIDSEITSGVLDGDVINMGKLTSNLDAYNKQQVKQAELARLNAELLEQQRIINDNKSKERFNDLEREKQLYAEVFRVQESQSLKGEQNAERRQRLLDIIMNTSLDPGDRMAKYIEEVRKIEKELGITLTQGNLNKGPELIYGGKKQEFQTVDDKAVDKAKKESERIQREIETLKLTMPVEAKVTGLVPPDPNPNLDVNPVIPPKSINDLEDELKKLKDNVGSLADPKKEAVNLEMIKKKQKEIDEEWIKVRKEQYGEQSKLNELKSKGVKVTATERVEITNQLAPMKKLTKEQEIQLKNQQKQIDDQIRYVDLMNELSNSLNEASDIFNSLGDVAGTFDEELGKSLKNMASIAEQSANLVLNLSSGNWIGVITSGLGLISTAISISEENSEKQNQLAEEYNSILRERIDLLVQAGLISKEEGTIRQTEELKKQLDLQKQILENFKVYLSYGRGMASVSFGSVMDLVYGKNWTPKDLEEAVSDLDTFISKYNELAGLNGSGTLSIYDKNEFEQAVNDYLSALADTVDYSKEAWNEILGFDGSGLAQEIFEGIRDGFELGKDSLGDFSSILQERLQTAMMTAILTSFDNNWTPKIMELINSSMNDGVIDQTEQGQIDKLMQDAIVDTQAKFDLIKGYFDGSNGSSKTESKTPLEGNRITGVSVENLSLLQGTMSSIQFNIIESKNKMDLQIATLSKIEYNTSHNHNLEDLPSIREGIKKTNALLQILAGSNTSSSDYNQTMGL